MRFIALFAFVLLAQSCTGLSSEWDIELWEQKIEGSELSIYQFDAWGGRDSNISGLKIGESERGFTQSDVYVKEDFSYLKSIPNKDTLEVFKIVKPKTKNSNKPTSQKTYQKKGLTIRQESYEYDRSVTGICTLKAYDFQSFEETRDSLIFYKNDSQFVEGKGFDRIAIPKGNVYLMTTRDNKFVARVVYSDLKLFGGGKETRGIKICNMTKYFDPIEELSISKFSDY
ncbi:MAG: hypothetical protein AAGC85_06745, partial [Bacteroidota bacterium]